jgi:signal peptidase I
MRAGRETTVPRPARSSPPRGRAVRTLAGAAGLLGLLFAWLYLAPAQVGGATSYAVIVGSSMEPNLHRGDLVLVRPQDRYGPGDVVLYDDPDLRSKVMHRIARVDGDRYVLKGDNNEFFDSAQPTDDRIVGALWATVPGAGRVTTWLRQPLHAALLVGIASLVALGGGAVAGGLVSRRRRRPRPRPEQQRPSGGPRHLPGVLAFACVAAGLLTIVAFTRPTSRLVTAEEPFAHEARLGYSATVAQSPVYPDGSVTTGEPVFLRLVPRLRVDVRYRLASEEPADVHGTIGLTARLSDGRGWSHVLQVAPEREFTALPAHIGGVVDLGRVQRLTEQVQELTGSGGGAYTITLAARVSAVGDVDGRPLLSSFSPEAEFDLADLRLQPKTEAGSAFLQREPVLGTVVAEESIRLGGARLSVSDARWLGSIALGYALLASLAALFLFGRRSPADEPARIAARYGRILVEIAAHAVDPARVLDLPDMQTLARIAAHHGRLILHTVEAGAHVYLVEEGETVFRYRAADGWA